MIQTIKKLNLKTIVVLLVLSIKSLNLLAQPCKEVIGYYPNWQWYDRNKLVNPQSIDYSKYTILNYCFFAPQPNGTINLTDSWADENLLLGQINWSTGGHYPNTSIIDLAHYHGVKVLATIGGWTLSDNFSAIAADPTKRATFAQSCLDLIQTYNFDGIDIDWEYPGFATHQGTPQDGANFTLLLQEIRTVIDNYGSTINKPMLLTACISAAPDMMLEINWAAISPILDAINLMSYDFFGAWDARNNHNAPLFAPMQGDTSFNLHSAVQTLIHTHQVNPQKLNAGIAFYGRSQTTTTTPTLFGNSTGLADNITFQIDQGTPMYYNVLANLHLFNEFWDNDAKVPYLIGANGLHTFLSYDDEQSIGLKAEYIVEQNLKGAIIWEITADYVETFPGSGIIQNTPLADTLNQVFCNYQPIINNLKTIDNKTLVSISPNPTTQDFTLEFSTIQASVDIEITNAAGQFIQQYRANAAQQITLTIDGASGVYFIKIRTANGFETTLRVVKLA